MQNRSAENRDVWKWEGSTFQSFHSSVIYLSTKMCTALCVFAGRKRGYKLHKPNGRNDLNPYEIGDKCYFYNDRCDTIL